MEESESTKLEEVDLAILEIFSEDGRVSLRKLSERLGKSPLTIKKHVKKLEEGGVIEDYGVTINYEKLGYNIMALIEVMLHKGVIMEFKKEVSLHPNVFAVYQIADSYDALLLVKLRSREELSNLLETITGFKSVMRTNTHLVLNVVKEGTNFGELLEFINEQGKI
ncbi:MAG: Lrp/AsnC family transcriptional regulator [Promethearchaeota archaeon]